MFLQLVLLLIVDDHDGNKQVFAYFATCALMGYHPGLIEGACLVSQGRDLELGIQGLGIRLRLLA